MKMSSAGELVNKSEDGRRLNLTNSLQEQIVRGYFK
jgi:hypothetical protein